MAKMELKQGLLRHLHGTICRDGNKRIIARTAYGKTVVYQLDVQQRSTPLSQAEIDARNRFSEANRIWKNLDADTKNVYQTQWVQDHYAFNGKQYATLKGYVIARLLAYLKKA